MAQLWLNKCYLLYEILWLNTSLKGLPLNVSFWVVREKESMNFSILPQITATFYFAIVRRSKNFVSALSFPSVTPRQLESRRMPPLDGTGKEITKKGCVDWSHACMWVSDWVSEWVGVIDDVVECWRSSRRTTYIRTNNEESLADFVFVFIYFQRRRKGKYGWAFFYRDRPRNDRIIAVVGFARRRRSLATANIVDKAENPSGIQR